MPPLPAAPGVVKVALSGEIFATNQWLTRFYLHYTGTAPTVAQLTTLNGAIASAYNTDLVPLASNEVELLQIETIDLTSATGAVATSATTNVGSRSGNILTAQAAVVSSYEISRRYRGGHPRGYWPFGVTTDLSAEITWSPTFVGTCTTNLNAFFTALKAAGWTGAGTITQVNVSYYNGFTVVTSPTTGRARNVPSLRVAPTVDTVSALVVRSSIGTQRRRLSFVD